MDNDKSSQEKSHTSVGHRLLALSFAVPTAAQAESAAPSPIPATNAPEVSSDSGPRYMSVAEAEERFGINPNELPEISDLSEISKISKISESTESTDPAISPRTSWWGCDYEGRADYPHLTNGEASVHGYWVKTGGTCPSTATVTANLQALYCDMSGNSGWKTQDTRSGTFTSGSGSGNWATPHKSCGGQSSVAWRGEVDVNLTDFADPLGYHYGSAKDLNCYPA